MRWTVLVVVAACSRGDSERSQPLPAAAPPPPPAPAAPLTRVAGCALATHAPEIIEPARLGHGSGYGVGGCGGHHHRLAYETPLSIGPAEGVGLDKAVVRRYFKRNLQKIRYCFEKRQLAEPRLAGTAKIDAELLPTGAVAKANVTGIEAPVASCLADTVAGIEFPKPKQSDAHASISFTFGDPAIAAQQPATAVERHEVWTPYAFGSLGAAPNGELAIGKTRAAVEAKLAALDACFGQTTGSARAMLMFAGGKVALARVGGLGDAKVESCLQAALAPLAADGVDSVELACDLVRGEPAPWRVTNDPSWLELDVTKTGSHVAGDTRPLESADAAYLDAQRQGKPGALVVADADAPGKSIARAAAWVNGLPIVLVAVADPPRAPRLLAVGHSDFTHSHEDLETTPRAISVWAAGAKVCANGKPVADIPQLAQACQGASCGSVTLAIEDGDVPAIVSALDVANRAGLDRVVIDSEGCALQ